MRMNLLFPIITLIICVKSLNGFQNIFVKIKQVKYMNLYLNPKPILQNDNESNNLLPLSFNKDQTTVDKVSSKAINKGTDLLINALYKGLLIEPVFGSLGLLKSTDDVKQVKNLKIVTIPSLTRSNNNNRSNEAFESKLASMISLEEETILNKYNLKDNELSVTMAPISKSSISSESTVGFTSTADSSSSALTSSVKKADFKDESWVVRKLKEIRTREITVVQAAASPPPSSSSTKSAVASTTADVMKSPPNTSVTSNVMKESITSNKVSVTAAATIPIPIASKSTLVSKAALVTPTVPTRTVRTPSPTMMASSNSEKVKAAVSNVSFSPPPPPPVGTVILPPAPVSTENVVFTPKIVTTEPVTEAKMVTPSPTLPPLTSLSTTTIISPITATTSSITTTTTTVAKTIESPSSSLQSDTLYELMPTSIISDGLVYGNVDKNAVNFNISADTFKLPIIAMDENTEFTAAQQAIKSAGLSGTVSYILSEVGFWMVSMPIIISSYHTANNEWLNIASPIDRPIIFGLLGGFMSVARLALPFRLAIAVGLTPVVDRYIIKKLHQGNGDEKNEVSGTNDSSNMTVQDIK